ncbi:MAG: DUF2096 family protein [Candidatus Jordarchaeaceae archaeon]
MENLSALEGEWYILNEMLGDLRSKKIQVPTSVFENLRYARLIITHYKESGEGETHKHKDYSTDLEVTMNNIRTVLFAKAQELGDEYVALWREKISEISPPLQRKKTLARGVSRDKGLDFVRIHFNKTIPESELIHLADKYNASIKIEGEKVAVVSGPREDVKKIIREIAEKYF